MSGAIDKIVPPDFFVIRDDADDSGRAAGFHGEEVPDGSWNELRHSDHEIHFCIIKAEKPKATTVIPRRAEIIVVPIQTHAHGGIVVVGDRQFVVDHYGFSFSSPAAIPSEQATLRLEPDESLSEDFFDEEDDWPEPVFFDDLPPWAYLMSMFVTSELVMVI